MKKKTIITTLVALAVIAGTVYWLTQKNSVKRGDKTVRIGAVLPLTGDMAFLGETGKNGLTLAQEYINQKKLLKGKEIKFIFGDGMGIPKNSINALNYLIEMEKTNIIFSIVSAVDVAFIPIQQEKQFLFVSHATHPALSNINPLFFRHSPTVLQEAEILQKYVGKDSSTTVLLSMSDDYGIAFSKIAQENGFISSKNIIIFNTNERDYKTLCLKAIKNKPSKILLCGNGKDQHKIATALRELNYKDEIITTLGFKVGGAYDVVKDKIDFTYVNFKKTNIDERYAEVLTKYKDKFGKDMTLNEMIFFNTALLLVDAINNVKEKDNANVNEIASNISKIKLFNGLGENISISSSNDILPELEVFNNVKN